GDRPRARRSVAVGADDLAPGLGRQGVVGAIVGGALDEVDRAVGEREVGPARVVRAGAGQRDRPARVLVRVIDVVTRLAIGEPDVRIAGRAAVHPPPPFSPNCWMFAPWHAWASHWSPANGPRLAQVELAFMSSSPPEAPV